MVIVLDCETTGLSPAVGHAVVELAAVALRLYPREIYNGADRPAHWELNPAHHHFTMLVAPGRRIPPEASVVHHLRDADVRCAPKLPNAIDAMLRAMGVRAGTLGGLPLDITGGFPPDPLIFAAHNAAFDRAFVGAYLPPVPWLCTYRLSCHLFPGAPSHSNQVLRYHLGLDAEVRAALPNATPPLSPHRALFDAVTTAVLLRHMLASHTPAELLALQDQPVLQRTVRFGKYRNQPWSAVPRYYLQYVMRQNGPGGFDADVLHTANHFLNGGT